MSIEEMMKDGKTDTFLHYERGELWHRSAAGFDYPVPVDDNSKAAFYAQDNAMQFMR